MCGGGGIGGLIGAGLGLALAPATGGASLAYMMAGSSIGQMVGNMVSPPKQPQTAPMQPAAVTTPAPAATQAEKQASTLITGAKRNAATAPNTSTMGGTLLTSAMGVSDQQLNLGKTKLGA